MIESVRALERAKSARPPHLVIYRLSLFRLVAASFAHRFPRLGLPDGVYVCNTVLYFTTYRYSCTCGLVRMSLRVALVMSLRAVLMGINQCLDPPGDVNPHGMT